MILLEVSQALCQLHCDADVDDCRAWNESRQKSGEPSYDGKM